jgi:hypothetical protein
MANEERLCQDLTKLKEHMASVKKVAGGKGRVCVVCGKLCYQKCTKCGKPMHNTAQKEQGRQHACFFDYHDTTMLGLLRSDFDMTKGMDGRSKRQQNWTWPTAQEEATHKDKIRCLLGAQSLPMHLQTPAHEQAQPSSQN